MNKTFNNLYVTISYFEWSKILNVHLLIKYFYLPSFIFKMPDKNMTVIEKNKAMIDMMKTQSDQSEISGLSNG